MAQEMVLVSLEELKDALRGIVKSCYSEMQPTAAPAPENTVFDIDAFCDYTGLSKQTVYRKTGKGEIPHSRQGKRLYFDKSEVDAWLMANKVTPQGIAQRAEAYNKKRAKRQASAL